MRHAAVKPDAAQSPKATLTCIPSHLNPGRGISREGSMTRLTRLDKLLFRLEAQHISLQWIFREIAGLPGVVFEMGLGHGRTYDHLRTHLPDREIYVLDREIDCFDDCIPPDDRLLLGDIADDACRRRHALRRPGDPGACRPRLVHRGPQCRDERQARPAPAGGSRARRLRAVGPAAASLPEPVRCRCPPARARADIFSTRTDLMRAERRVRS